MNAENPGFWLGRAVAGHLRGRARDGAAGVSVGVGGAPEASSGVVAPARARRRAGAGVYGAWALVHGQARTLGVPQTGRVRHPGDVLWVLAAYTRRLADIRRRVPWPWVLVCRPVLAARAVQSCRAQACHEPKVANTLATSSVVASASKCRRLALVWRRLRAWACSSPSSAGVAVELAVLAGRGRDRQALSPLVNARAQASACEREHSALALSSVALSSGTGEPQRALSGPLRPHTAPLTLPLPTSGAGSLPSPWGAT